MPWQRFAHTKDACDPLLVKDAALPEDKPLMNEAPPWRQFMPWDEFQENHAIDANKRWQQLKAVRNPRAEHKANSFFLPETSKACQELVLAVNAALALRRPLLLSGLPGSGKTSLAFVIANWLGLGPVLEWPVTPGALLADALATYNPLARLRDLEAKAERQVEDYIRLGPVGTAFLPSSLPRVLLIDEIDKGDLNLANELLHLFEEGKFAIAELQRAERDRAASNTQAGSKPETEPEPETESEAKTEPTPKPEPRVVEIWDELDGKPLTTPIRGGQVQCHEFPLVVMSSNGEREFPPAFNRRCLRVRMPDFSKDRDSLRRIVLSHLNAAPTKVALDSSLKRSAESATDPADETAAEASVETATPISAQVSLERGEESAVVSSIEQALDAFAKAAEENRGDLATDQLLNLAYLMDNNLGRRERERLSRVLLQGLNSEAGSDADGSSDFDHDLDDDFDD
ncbi:MAG: AAA family ATPase, partial [Synechococcaceae cyanobacterium]